jgi:hypothetical protein
MLLLPCHCRSNARISDTLAAPGASELLSLVGFTPTEEGDAFQLAADNMDRLPYVSGACQLLSTGLMPSSREDSQRDAAQTPEPPPAESLKADSIDADPPVSSAIAEATAASASSLADNAIPAASTSKPQAQAGDGQLGMTPDQWRQQHGKGKAITVGGSAVSAGASATPAVKAQDTPAPATAAADAPEPYTGRDTKVLLLPQVHIEHVHILAGLMTCARGEPTKDLT